MVHTKKFTVTALVLALLGCGGGGGPAISPAEAGPVCEQTLRSWSVTADRSLNNTAWGWSRVQEPVRLGRQSQRFEVRPGDCASDPGWSDCAQDRERSEMTVNQVVMPNTQQSVSWSVYLEPGFQDSARVKTTLGQLHQRAWFKNGPLLQFELWNGQYQMCIHRLTGDISAPVDRCEYWPLATLSDMQGRWTDVQFEIDTSIRTGWLKVWVNGQIKADIKTPVVVWDPTNFYFKYGVYRSFVSRQGAPMPTQIAYFDEVRMAPRAGLIAPQCNTNPVD